MRNVELKPSTILIGNRFHELTDTLSTKLNIGYHLARF